MSDLTQPAANNPNDGTIPYHQVYFGCCNRTVMTREDVAQPGYCPFCGAARQANQPQGKAQPEQPGINLARWIWQRFSGIPITEPYDGEFRLLLLKIASYTDELKQRQSFADFHAESKEPSLTYTLDQLNAMLNRRGQDEFQRGQQAMAEKAAQSVRNLVLVFQLTEQDLAERKGAEKMREAILEQFRSLASAEPPQGETEKEGRGW